MKEFSVTITTSESETGQGIYEVFMDMNPALCTRIAALEVDESIDIDGSVNVSRIS